MKKTYIFAGLLILGFLAYLGFMALYVAAIKREFGTSSYDDSLESSPEETNISIEPAASEYTYKTLGDLTYGIPVGANAIRENVTETQETLTFVFNGVEYRTYPSVTSEDITSIFEKTSLRNLTAPNLLDKMLHARGPRFGDCLTPGMARTNYALFSTKSMFVTAGHTVFFARFKYQGHNAYVTGNPQRYIFQVFDELGENLVIIIVKSEKGLPQDSALELLKTIRISSKSPGAPDLGK